MNASPRGSARPRVVLRDLAPGDLPALFQHQRDPVAARMAAFMPERYDDWEAYLARWTRIIGDGTNLTRAILADDMLAGSIVSFTIEGDREVSYGIERELWGRGIATEALTAFLHVERTRPLHARAAKDNAGSVKVLTRCGFVITAEERGFASMRGAEIDELVLRLDA